MSARVPAKRAQLPQDCDGAPGAVSGHHSGSVRLTLGWQYLCSSNERHKAGGGKARAHSQKYRESREALWLLGLKQTEGMRRPVFATGAVELVMDFYPPNRIRRDEMNICKGFCDAMNGVLYADDSQVTRCVVERFAVDAKNPRLEVTARALVPCATVC